MSVHTTMQNAALHLDDEGHVREDIRPPRHLGYNESPRHSRAYRIRQDYSAESALKLANGYCPEAFPASNDASSGEDDWELEAVEDLVDEAFSDEE